MRNVLVRASFVGYILVLAVLSLGRFGSEVEDVLRAFGLRSAVGIFAYLVLGLLVAWAFLLRRGADLRDQTQQRQRHQLQNLDNELAHIKLDADQDSGRRRRE